MNYSSSYTKFLLAFIFISISFYLGRSIFGSSVSLYLGIATGGMLFLSMVQSSIPRLLQLYLFVAGVGFCFLIMNNGFSSGKLYLPILLSSIGIALAIRKTVNTNPRFHLFISKFLFFGMSFYFLMHFAVYGDFDLALSSSRNHVSVNLIFISCYYILVRRWTGVPIPAIYPVLILSISILAVGIAGIVSAIIIFLGYFLSQSKKNLFLVTTFGFVAFFAVDIPGLLNLIDDDLLRKVFFKLSEGDIRADITSNYIANLDLIKFLTGVPISDLQWTISGREGDSISSTNLHSSYLLLHAKIGIMFFFVMFGIFLVIIKLLKKDFFVFCLFLALVVRASTDTIAFSHGYHEWILILFVLYAVEKSNFSKRKTL